MYNHLTTPGVYIKKEEQADRSPRSVASAIPVFIGYTEKIHHQGNDIRFKAIKIDSLSDYINIFGRGAQRTYTLLNHDLKNITVPQIKADPNTSFILFESLRLYFLNGGGTCYIISVGSHHESELKSSKDFRWMNHAEDVIQLDKLLQGIQVLALEEEPSILVIPEAVMLADIEQCGALQKKMLHHCSLKKFNRFAILDIYKGDLKRTYDEEDIVSTFRTEIGNQFLSYGAAYYPWLDTSITPDSLVNFRNISNLSVLVDILKKEIAEIELRGSRKKEAISEVNRLKDLEHVSDIRLVEMHQTYLSISPFYQKLISLLHDQLNLFPPSAAIAGVYVSTDLRSGVWKSPTNEPLEEIISPVITINHQDQEDLNVPINGKAINAIRSFVNEGILVWGARTLEGNSQNLRYINVRRTLSFIEHYIAKLCRAYVFESNNDVTWQSIAGSITNFLNDFWKRGGIVGPSPQEAYILSIGLGESMTENDILEGLMKINIQVAISRPMEFIHISYQQKMIES